MSTRGSVCWKEPNGEVKDVYNHFDSYPSGLGKEVFVKAQVLGVQGLIDQLKQWGDWREFENGGICEYCGKVAGQPHSISGKVCIADKVEGQYPDPDAKLHSHGDGVADQFDPFTDPLFMEWIYLLDPLKNVIEVWHFASNETIEERIKAGGQEVTHSDFIPLKSSLGVSYFCEMLVATIDPKVDTIDALNAIED